MNDFGIFDKGIMNGQKSGQREAGRRKKGLVGPCQRSGLAAGINLQADDGGNLRLFFVAGTRTMRPRFIFSQDINLNL